MEGFLELFGCQGPKKLICIYPTFCCEKDNIATRQNLDPLHEFLEQQRDESSYVRSRLKRAGFTLCDGATKDHQTVKISLIKTFFIKQTLLLSVVYQIIKLWLDNLLIYTKNHNSLLRLNFE